MAFSTGSMSFTAKTVRKSGTFETENGFAVFALLQRQHTSNLITKHTSQQLTYILTMYYFTFVDFEYYLRLTLYFCFNQLLVYFEAVEDFAFLYYLHCVVQGQIFYGLHVGLVLLMLVILLIITALPTTIISFLILNFCILFTLHFTIFIV